MRCLDRNCRGRLHLEIEKDVTGKVIYRNPELSGKCTLLPNNHSWIKKDLVGREIEGKSLASSDLDRRSIQIIYFEKKMKDVNNITNLELIKAFKKENPQTSLNLQSRDLTIIRQNLKRKAIESNRATDRVDSILTSSGHKFLLEKVKDLNYSKKTPIISIRLHSLMRGETRRISGFLWTKI